LLERRRLRIGRGNVMEALTKVFNNHEIRIVINECGDPLFVAVDVCGVLDITNTSDGLGRLDADERTLVSVEGASNGRPVNAITEAGLYSLVLGSRKPEAQRFKRWVTHEVLPTIRKGRVELAPQTREQRLAVAFQDALDIIGEKDAQLAAAQPKIDHYDRFADAKGRYGLQQAARVLGQHPNKWIKQLRDDGYLFYQGGKLVPKAEYIECGFFEVKEGEVGGKAYCQTYVMPKGILHFGAQVGSLTLVAGSAQ
jgi:anti-repressor protein